MTMTRSTKHRGGDNAAAMLRVIRTARALHAEVRRSSAEHLSVTIGFALKRAREHKPSGITWAAYCKKRFGICKSQAGTLMRIAGGTITAKALRDRGAARLRKHRAKMKQDKP
jgi:hypothetical protein